MFRYVYRNPNIQAGGYNYNTRMAQVNAREGYGTKNCNYSGDLLQRNVNLVNPGTFLFRSKTNDNITHAQKTKSAESRLLGKRSSSLDKWPKSDKGNNHKLARDVHSILKNSILQRRENSWITPSKVEDLCIRGRNEVFYEKPASVRPCVCSRMGKISPDCVSLPSVRPEASRRQKEKADEKKNSMSSLIDYWKLEVQKKAVIDGERCRSSPNSGYDLRGVSEGTSDQRCLEIELGNPVKEDERKGSPSKITLTVVLPNIADDIW